MGVGEGRLKLKSEMFIKPLRGKVTFGHKAKEFLRAKLEKRILENCVQVAPSHPMRARNGCYMDLKRSSVPAFIHDTGIKFAAVAHQADRCPATRKPS